MKDDSSLVLPTKDQIVKGLADIEIQIKSKAKCMDRLKNEIEEALKQEEEEKRVEEEAAKERKRIRQQEEERERQLQLELEKERERKRLEKIRQLRQEMNVKERELEELKKRRGEELLSKKAKMESDFELEWQSKIEKKERTLRKAKDTLSAARARAAKAGEDIAEKQKALEEKQGMDESSVQESALVSPDHDAADRVPLSFDEPEQMKNLVSSIMKENRRRAQQAHLDSLSILPYAPLPEVGAGIDETINETNVEKANVDTKEEGSSQRGCSSDNAFNEAQDNRSAVAASEKKDEDDEVEDLTPVSNAEWTALTRRIMSPADALYVDPMDSPYWEYHEQWHNKIGHLVMEEVTKKKNKLYQHWEDLAKKYLAWQILRKNSSGDDSSDETEENNKRASSTRPSRNLAVTSYRRPRRPPRGGTGLLTSFIGGLRDVIRSEYEQELITKELAEKEARERRIKHGGCALPRQKSVLERVSF